MKSKKPPTAPVPEATSTRTVVGNRVDFSAALDSFQGPLDLLLLESGGDNLTLTFSTGLIDVQLFVLDVAGGDKVPRKGGPGVTESDLLIVNKTDLAPHVGPDLGVMERDARRMRGEGPTVFAQVTRGVGIEAIAAHVLAAWRAAVGGGERGPYAPGEHAG